MLRMRQMLAPLVVLALAAPAFAHPHFNKTVTAKLPSGVEVTITYGTTPSNEINAQNAAVGTFVTPRRPMLKLSADVQAGQVTIPAGEYTIGVIKNADKDWTLALYPGAVARGQQPDMAKVLKLDSALATDAGTAPHMLVDISPGFGKLEGRATLTIHFGTLFLAGALS
jgi:hypothetical protein